MLDRLSLSESSMSKRDLAVLILLASACGACVSPREGSFNVSSKPGWGRTYSPEEERLTVRAVPAAATPVRPVPSLGKPGWGRAIPVSR